MKRIKKSMKILITLSCVFLLAVAGVVTAIVVNNSKSKKPGDNPESGYVLTAGQKLLVSEINSAAASEVSSSHKDVLEYTHSSIPVDKVEYFNDSILWTSEEKFISFSSSEITYSAYVIAENGSEEEFLAKFKASNLISDENYTAKIISASKNFVVLDVVLTGGEKQIVLTCVQNHEIKIAKTISYSIADNGTLQKNGKKFAYAFSENFFVYLDYNDGFSYKLFEYKSNYDNYTEFNYSLSKDDDANKGIYINGNDFYLMADANSKEFAVRYDENLGFSSSISSEDSITFKNATIKVIKTEASSQNSAAEKLDDKYYTYTYKFSKSGGVEKAINLGSYNKINASVVYSGENYFALFMQKIENNSALSSGQIVYFDYDLNVIASYIASSLQERILFSSGEAILTSGGLYLTKNSVNLSKSYDFSANGFDFIDVLSNGNFVLKDSYGNCKIYNFSLGVVLSQNFDEITTKINDSKIIFKAQGEYYLYELGKTSASKINFESSGITSSTGLYFVKNDDGKFSLLGGENSVNDIKSYDFDSNQNCLTLTLSDNSKKSYYLVENQNVSASNVGNVSENTEENVFVSNTGSSSSASGTVSNSAIRDDIIEENNGIEGDGSSDGGASSSISDVHSGGFKDEDVVADPSNWYNYTDRLSKKVSPASGSSVKHTTYVLKHFITDGTYSKTGEYDSEFVDYLELNYSLFDVNATVGTVKTTYSPFRIYYQVDVSGGNPVLKIGQIGHYYIGHVSSAVKGSISYPISKYKNWINAGSDAYILDQLHLINLSGGVPAANIAYYGSFDYSYISGNGLTSYQYIYKKSGFIEQDNGSYYGIRVRVADSGDDESTENSNASVYGNSICVTFYIDIAEFSIYNSDTEKTERAVFTGWKFGQNKINENCYILESGTFKKDNNSSATISNSYYYNKLYYQTIVVGVNDETMNIDTDIIQKQSVSDLEKPLSATKRDKILEDNSTMSTIFVETNLGNGYSATLSNKTYFSTGSQNLNFGTSLKLDIVGAKLLGISTLNREYIASNAALYSSDTETYLESAVEFRIRDDGGDNPNVKSYTGLKKDTSNENYYISIENNGYYIYTQGMLNTYRFVYCIYEPQVYSVEFDYNIANSGEENDVSVDDESNYLQNYAGISIGNSNKMLVPYTSTWVYKNVANKNEFANFEGTSEDKYAPKNFLDTSTRTPDSTSGGSETNYDVVETTVTINEIKNDGYRLFYIIVDGIKYFFQYEDRLDKGSNPVYASSAYVVAYKDFSTIKSKYSEPTTDSTYLDSAYVFGDEKIYIKFNRIIDEVYTVSYRNQNLNTRTAKYSSSNYFYTSKATTVCFYNENGDWNNNITETFTFRYSDDVILNSNPEHIHYKFKGWRVYYTTADYLLITLTDSDISSGGLNINPYVYLSNDQYLAGNANLENWRDFLTAWSGSKAVVESDGSITWNTKNVYSGKTTSGPKNNSYFTTSGNYVRIVAEWEPIECTIEAILWTKEIGGSHNSLKYDATESTKISSTLFAISSSSITPKLYSGSDDIDIKDSGKSADGKMTYVKFKYNKNKTFLDIGKELYNIGLREGGVQSNNINSRFAGWAVKDLSENVYYSMVQSVIDDGANNYAEITTIKNYIGDTAQITIYAYYKPSAYDFTISMNPLGGAQFDEEGKDYTQEINEGVVTDKIYNKTSAAAVYELKVYNANNTEQSQKFITDDIDGYTILGLNQYEKYKASLEKLYYVENSIGIDIKIRDENETTSSQMYYVKKIVISDLTLMGDDGIYHKYTVTLLRDDSRSETSGSTTGWICTVKSEDGSANLGVASDDGYNFKFGNNSYNYGSATTPVHNQIYLNVDNEGKVTLVITNLSNPGTITADGSQQFFSGEKGFDMEITADSYTIINEKVDISIGVDDDSTEFEYNAAVLTATQSVANIEGKMVKVGDVPYAWIGGYKYLLNAFEWAGTLTSGYYNLHTDMAASYYSNYSYKDFINQTFVPGSELVVYYDDKTKLIHYPVQITKYEAEGTGTGSSEGSGTAITSPTTLKIDYNNTRVLVIDPEQTNNYLSEQPNSFQSIDKVYELKYYLSSIKLNGVTFSFYPITRDVKQDGSKLYYSYMKLNASTTSGITRLYDEDEATNNYWSYTFLGDEYVINDAFKIELSLASNIKGASVYYFYIGRTASGNTKYFLIYDEKPDNAYVDYDDGNHIDISLVFEKQENKILFNVTEKDLYVDDLAQDANDSFEFEYSADLSKTKDDERYELFDFVGVNYEASETIETGKFYRVGLDINENYGKSYTRQWTATSNFYPSDTLRYRLNAKNGYIIDSIKIYVGKFSYVDHNGNTVEDNFRNIISFEIDTATSFENLIYYSATGNYSYTVVESDILKSQIVYKIARSEEEVNNDTALGYSLYDSASKLGLLYSNHENAEWRYDDTSTFNFDQIYMLLGGMYEDVKIEITTTTFSEWIFENGDSGDNPLLKEHMTAAAGTYVDIDFDKTYLNLYVSVKNDEGIEEFIEITDDSLKTLKEATSDDEIIDPNDENNWIKPYILRYYPSGTIGANSTGLAAGTIRLIFYGKGSIINNGLKFIATEDDHSSYFSNARYYNEKSSDNGYSADVDVFKNLTNYSGRTSDNNRIMASTLKKNNKLVYMYYGKLTHNVVGATDKSYFKDSYPSSVTFIKPNQESNYKYLVALTTYTNTINVDTSSYLFNDTLFNDYRDILGAYTRFYGTEGGDDSDGYNFIEGKENKILSTLEGYGNKLYQLDDTSKTKSWFNDTVLTNIQYNSYLNTNMTWANRTSTSIDTSVSQLTSVEMSGLKFNWQYYEIAGYYLNSIMIYLEDLGRYYLVNVPNLISDNNLSFVSNRVKSSEGAVLITTFSIPSDTVGYCYTFNLFYENPKNSNDETVGGCFKLYPVMLNTSGENSLLMENDSVDDDGNVLNCINWLESISLVSNNIKVAFLSDAYSFKLSYNSYDSEYTQSGHSISTYEKAVSGTNPTIENGKSVVIYYDSMLKLDYTPSMEGYTFIGWGSEKYFDGSTKVSRFTNGSTQVAATWNTSSSWFDVASLYFTKAGNTGVQNSELFYKLYLYYNSNYSNLPGTSYYTPNSYFMTDTGYVSGVYAQNYNFFAEYLTMFSAYIGHALDGSVFWNDSSVPTQEIKLYGLYKANIYAVQFEVNNSKEDDFKINYKDYKANYLGTTYNGWLLNDFLGDKINFRTKTYSTYLKDGETKVKETTSYYTGYVTFDTNKWYYLTRNVENQQQFSVINGPYTVSNMTDENCISELAIDMYGYSWLGWYYTKLDDINQGDTTNTTTRVFNSSYMNNTKNSKVTSLPIFNNDFIEKGVTCQEITTPKVTYYGEHKASGSTVSLSTGYIYYYDYSYTDSHQNNTQNEITGGGCKFNYIDTCDYLNTFLYSTDGDGNYSIQYEQESNSAMLLSYFDTCFSKDCYSISIKDSKYSLTLNRASKNLRNIKLYAAWSQNKYLTRVDLLDKDGKVQQIGSSPTEWVDASNKISTGKAFYYNDKTLEYYLNTYATIPIRIGYDFVGWGFSYVNSNSYAELATTINTESSVLYLCKELLAKYEKLKDVNGANIAESTVLMLNGNLLDSVNSTWTLNGKHSGSTYGETYGDEEDETKRYIYVFPIWKVQTFSIDISLNIAKEELKNLYEKDSSFTVGLYEGSSYTSSTGVSSKFYTYNSTKQVSETNYSYYPYYFNDIVANINFEMEFDTSIETAKLSFANKTYKLSDLFATSAGYYFLGLMTKQIDYDTSKTQAQNLAAREDYFVVRNTLKSHFDLEDGLTSDNPDGDSLFKNSLVLNYNMYIKNTTDDTRNLYVTKHSDSNITNNITNMDLMYNIDYGSNGTKLKYSSNFGTITIAEALIYSKSGGTYSQTNTSRTFKIMSEYVNGEYYLFILHNNTRYYVVYYETASSARDSTISDLVTFDKTYLYHNVKDSTGSVVGKYIINFDTDGNAYYVTDGFKERTKVYLKVALYTSRRNKLLLTYESGSAKISEYNASTNPNGSLISNYGTIVNATNSLAVNISTLELSNYKSRAFTLYADWGIKTVTTDIVNGNNTGSNYDSNAGLAGFFYMDYYSELEENKSNKHKTVMNKNSDNGQNAEKITATDQFYYSNGITILPFYNGRFISEMTFEFDSLNEETQGGTTSIYSMKHNTLKIKFKWDNVNLQVVISEMYLNDFVIASGYEDSYISGSTYNYLKVSELSLIDKFSINNHGSGIILSNRLTTSNYNDNGTRYDINKLNFSLTNIMTDLKITCKFSIQTFDVVVYDVLTNESIVRNGSIYQTAFVSQDAMVKSALYTYISKNSYNNAIFSTLSTDCATGGSSVKEYNIPYGYVPSYNRSVYGLTYRAFDGFDYYFGNSGYHNGNATANSLSRYHSGDNEGLAQIKKEVGTGYAFDKWYLYNGISNGYVTLVEYGYSKTPVSSNTTIYGMFTNSESKTRVLFYYWDGDEETGKYVQIQDEDIINAYTSGTYSSQLQQGTSNGKTIWTIKNLPDPSIAEWCGGKDTTKQFVGYIYLTSSVVSSLTNTTTTYDSYDSSEHKAASYYKETSADIWSAVYNNKAYRKSNNTLISTSTYNSAALKSAINGIAKVNLLRYRIQVKDSIYYLKQDSNGNDTNILYGIRAAIGINLTIGGSETGRFDVYKDMLMLNSYSELPNGETIYAIPIYDELELNITGVYARKNSVNGENTFKLTNDSNMIESKVFITGDKYTTYYSPNNLKFVVLSGTNTSQITKQKIENGSEAYSTYKFSLIDDGDANTVLVKMRKEETDDLRQFIGVWENKKFTSGFKLAAYYENSKGVIVMVSNTIYVSTSVDSNGRNYLSIRSSDGRTIDNKAKIEIYDSPVDVELNTDNQKLYERASDIIEDGVPDNSTYKEDEIINRKLVVLIALQLMQINDAFRYTSIIDENSRKITLSGNERYYYYFSTTGGSNPSSPSTNLISLTKVTEILNKFAINIATDSEQIYINTNGFYRLVYSLAYYYKKDQVSLEVESSYFGLEDFVGTTAKYPNMSNFTDETQQALENSLSRSGSGTTTSSLEDGAILPGDFMKDDRSGRYYEVIDVLNNNNNSRVYFTQANVDLGMYLGDDKTNIYICSGINMLTCSIDDYNEQEYQNTYTTRHFVVSKGSSKNYSNLEYLNTTVTNSANGIVYYSNYSNTYLGLNMGIIYDVDEDTPFSMGHDNNLKDVVSVNSGVAAYVYTYCSPADGVSVAEYIKKYDYFGGYGGYTFSLATGYGSTYTSKLSAYTNNNGYYYGTYRNAASGINFSVYDGYSTVYAKVAAETELSEYESTALGALDTDSDAFGDKYAVDKIKYYADKYAGSDASSYASAQAGTKPTAVSYPLKSDYTTDGVFNEESYNAAMEAYTKYQSEESAWNSTYDSAYSSKYSEKYSYYDSYLGTNYDDWKLEGKEKYENQYKSTYLAQYKLRQIAMNMGSYSKYNPDYKKYPDYIYNVKTFAGYTSYEYLNKADTAYFEIHGNTAVSYRSKTYGLSTEDAYTWLTSKPSKYYGNGSVGLSLPYTRTTSITTSYYSVDVDDYINHSFVEYGRTYTFSHFEITDGDYYDENYDHYVGVIYKNSGECNNDNFQQINSYYYITAVYVNDDDGREEYIHWGSLQVSSSGKTNYFSINGTVVSGYDLNEKKYTEYGTLSHYYWIIARSEDNPNSPKIYTRYISCFSRITS